MRVHKFRVKNYKAIRDSGDCYLSDGITLLAGKNEAGKSSLLEALEDFTQGRQLRHSAIPIEDETAIPEVSVCLDLATSEIEALGEALDLALHLLPSSVRINVVKKYPDIYSVHLGSVEQLQSSAADMEVPIRLELRSIVEDYDVVASSFGMPIPNDSDSDHATLLRQLQKWQARIQPNLGHWMPEQSEDLQRRMANVIAALQRVSAAVDPQSRAMAAVMGLLPNFILFSSFSDDVPNQVQLSELVGNSWISDLRAISDLDIEKIRGNNDRAKVTHKTQLNTRLNADFKQFWSQDDSQLFIDYDNQKLSFWFHENGKFYEPAIRSQGRRWHLAFYIRISARARQDVRNVILIDEPGLYLHANAQRDILQNLEQASSLAQIIFTTHSPYLIEHDKLDRIRLIQKCPEFGTRVENKVHAVADKETLTPILTAIGLELNRGIVAADRARNVIVEGPSDYFYLHAFKFSVAAMEINFVFGGGAGNMPKVGTILQGWGCEVVYLYDSDVGYKNAVAHIKADWVNITRDLLAKLPVDGSIEDIFSKEDFARHVLGVDATEIRGKNSEHMKGRDKVLPSRLFLEKCRGSQKPVLTEVTTKNIAKLFNQVGGMFVKAS